VAAVASPKPRSRVTDTSSCSPASHFLLLRLLLPLLQVGGPVPGHSNVRDSGHLTPEAQVTDACAVSVIPDHENAPLIVYSRCRSANHFWYAMEDTPSDRKHCAVIEEITPPNVRWPTR
jgi:hypothetical protein